jgi:hypothetical protein
MNAICIKCCSELDPRDTMPDPEGKGDLCFNCFEEAQYQYDNKQGASWIRERLPRLEDFVVQYCQCNNHAKVTHKALEGNCHAAAHVLVGMLEGVRVKARIKRGFWLGGDVRPERANFPGQQHSWVELEVPTNVIVFYLDPTQCFFTGEKPHIAITNEDDRRYDPGGYHFREIFQGKRSMPARQGKLRPTELGTQAQGVIAAVYGKRDWSKWTPEEMHTVANTNPNYLMGSAREIFEAICKSGRPGLIPIDARLEIIGR